MHENTIGAAGEVESSNPRSAIDRLKSINEKMAPVTTVVSLFLIIEGYTRKDWNQIAIGVGLAVPGYYGLGEAPSENYLELSENPTVEVDVFSGAEQSNTPIS